MYTKPGEDQAALALLRDSLTQPWQIYDLSLVGPSGWNSKEEIWMVLEEYYHKSIKKQTTSILNPDINYYELIDRIGMYIDSTGKVVYKPLLTRNEIVKLRIPVFKEGLTTSFRNKYGLDDPEFWTESIVWKKGLRVPWLYNFQTHSHIVDVDQIIEYNIPYPDSIIKLYRED